MYLKPTKYKIMTPKDKAQEIWNKLSIQEFSNISGWYENKQETKRHCLVLIQNCKDSTLTQETYNKYRVVVSSQITTDYWNEVEDEINKIDY